MIRTRCFSSWKRTGDDFDHAIALDKDLLRAVDQDVGDGWVLEQRLKRPKAQQLVEHVGDQLLALDEIERMILLGQLLADDVADFGLDLRVRHLVERGQVDQVEQPLVKLDLEVGLRVALGKCTGIAKRHQPLLLARECRLLDWSSGGGAFTDLPHRINASVRARRQCLRRAYQYPFQWRSSV